MASGKQIAEQSLKKFNTWVATQTDESFTQIIHRGALSRTEVGKAVGFGRKALKENPGLRTAFENLEKSLRKRGVLPDKTQKAKDNLGKEKKYDQRANRKMLDSKRLSFLEQENIDLKAKLSKFTEMAEALSKMGMVPR